MNECQKDHNTPTTALLAAVFCIVFHAGISWAGASQPVARTVTPNSDGRNDTFVFKCYNPRDAGITAEIYGIKGEKIAVMKLLSVSGFYYNLQWDPNAGGRAPSGPYLYRIAFGTTVLKGTVTVIR